MPDRVIGAGLRFLHYGILDSNGRLIGNTADGATAGDTTGEGLRRLEGAQTFPTQTPQPENVVISGDDAPLVSFTFAAEELANGVIAMAARDYDFEAVVTGTKNRTVGPLQYIGQDATSSGNVTVSLLGQRVAKEWTPAARGVAKWEWVLITRAEVTPLGSEIAQRTGSPYNYYYTASKGDSPLTGLTFTVSNEGYTQTTILTGRGDNPVYWHSFVGNNSVTDFALPFAPAAGTSLYVAVNGVLQTVTTDYTITGTSLSFTSAPATDARIVVVFETDEENL